MKNITLILLTLSMLNWSCKAQNNTMKDYEKATDTIINQIIALKSKHPEQLSTIKDARIEKEITTEKFWKGFHYEKGKHIVHLSGIKKTEGVVSFEEDGIELHIYFFKGDWTGAAAVSIIPFGDLNSVIFIKNDKNGLYQDIEKIIKTGREKLKENDKNSYNKTISRDKAIQIVKNEVEGKILGVEFTSFMKNRNWHISLYQKSVYPLFDSISSPKYYVIDAVNGEILLRLDNTDNPTQKEKLNNYLNHPQKIIMKDYENVIDGVVNQIIALKAKYPKKLFTIDRTLKGELIDLNPYFYKEISEDNFWAKFHYQQGKHIEYSISSKPDIGLIAFDENGIELSIYFFKGDWTGNREAKIIPFGNFNSAVIIRNDNNRLYQDIEKIIVAERQKLEKTISREEAIQIAKDNANGFLGTWVDCSLKNRNWHISASSKSANPPKYYVIDAINGKILLRLDNTDNPTQKEKLNIYLNHPQIIITEDYKKAIELAEKLMIEKKLILDEYNLVKIQNQFLYGEDKGKAATSVWKIIYLVKRTDGEDVYMIRGGEIFIEVDIKTQTAKITGWGE